MRTPIPLVHLRRISLRQGVPVVSCTSAPIRTGTTVRFANFPEDATCPRCLEAHAKQQARLERQKIGV